jgi:hypothetical protein
MRASVVCGLNTPQGYCCIPNHRYMDCWWWMARLTLNHIDSVTDVYIVYERVREQQSRTEIEKMFNYYLRIAVI